MADGRCPVCAEVMGMFREAKPRLLKQLAEEAKARMLYIQRRVDRSGEPSLRTEYLKQKFFPHL